MRCTIRKTAVTGTSLITAVAAMLMIGIAAPAPAHAAGCFAAGCAGRDPYAEGCQITASNTGGIAYGQAFNYYSTDCRANWAYATLNQQYIDAGYSMYVTITTIGSDNQQETMCSPTNVSGNIQEPCAGTYNGPVAWTDMVDGTNITDAQVLYFDANGNFVGSIELPL